MDRFIIERRPKEEPKPQEKKFVFRPKFSKPAQKDQPSTHGPQKPSPPDPLQVMVTSSIGYWLDHEETESQVDSEKLEILPMSIDPNSL